MNANDARPSAGDGSTAITRRTIWHVGMVLATCGMLAVLGGQALFALAERLVAEESAVPVAAESDERAVPEKDVPTGPPTGPQTTVLTLLAGITVAAVVAWLMGFVHATIQSPREAVGRRFSGYGILTAVVIGMVFQVYGASFGAITEWFTRGEADNRFARALFGDLEGGSRTGFVLTTIIWLLSAIMLALVLTYLVPSREETEGPLVMERGFRAVVGAVVGLLGSLASMVLALGMVVLIRIGHVFLTLVKNRDKWRGFVERFYAELPEKEWPFRLFRLPGQVVLWIDDWLGRATWVPFASLVPIATLAILVWGVFGISQEDRKSPPIFVVWLGLWFLLGSLVLAFVTPVFTWDLFTIPRDVWMAFVVPGVALGVLTPFTRTPGEERWVWAGLTMLLAVVLAAVTWRVLEPGWVWWTMLAGLGVLAVAFGVGLSDREWWPLLAVCAALLTGTLTLVAGGTFGDVRNRLATSTIPISSPAENVRATGRQDGAGRSGPSDIAAAVRRETCLAASLGFWVTIGVIAGTSLRTSTVGAMKRRSSAAQGR